MTDSTRMPVGFVGHGPPTLALDREKGRPLRAWGRALPRPKAILVLSAHWESTPPTLGATDTVPLRYDFFDFPEALSTIRYPAPGAPGVADEIEALIGHDRVRRRPGRGLDHGAWTPLVWMYPDSDVPVVQLSVPGSEAGSLFALGAKLAPLRDEGVFILGSGNITHNLGQVDWESRAVVPDWAHEFDDWAASTLGALDVDSLLRFREVAPALKMAHPTLEHFTPLLVVAGAALGGGGAPSVSFPVTGWEFGCLSRRCVQMG